MIAFLELPVALPGFNDEQTQNEDKIVTGKFYPQSIIAYHESYYGDTYIYLTNGQPFLIPLPVSEYERRIKEYFKQIEIHLNRKIKPLS